MSKKEDILKFATILFAEKGFNNTSMVEVADMAQVSSATIFYHYQNKEDLLVATLESVKDGIVEVFDKYIEESEFKSGLDMMEGLISLYMFLSGSKEHWFLLLHNHSPYLIAKVNSVCRDYLEDIYTSLTDIFEHAIAIGKQDGSIVDVDAGKTALILFSMIDGVVRFKIRHLYHVDSLYRDLMESCRKILQN